MIYKRCHCPAACRHPFWYEFVLNGIRYRRSTKTANRQTAGRVEERRRIAILEGRDEDQTRRVTLKTHIEEYVEYTAQKNRTAYKDLAVLQRVLDATGDRPLGEVSPFHIERWKTQRAGEVARATVNRELNIVRGCFARAVEWRRLRSSPVDAVRAYRVDDQRIRVLNDQELATILLKGDATTALICRVTLECLPRLSEVLGIHKDHIGPSWIEVRRKGGTVERIAVAEDLRDALLGRVHAQSGFVFGEGATGQPPYEQLASQRIKRALVRLGIQGATHHTMRHTGVTLMLEAGVNPRVIQRLAGWSSLRMLERYGHARDTELRRAVTSNAAYLAGLSLEQAQRREA